MSAGVVSVIAGGVTIGSVSVSPASQSPSAASSSHTFSSESASTTGIVNSYNWSYTASSGGTWSVSGSTTATATPSVSGVANGATATATLRCLATINGIQYTDTASLSFHNTTVSTLDTQTVTTGGSGSALNQTIQRGFLSGTYGSISDGTSNIYSGAAITAFFYYQNGGAPYVRLTITGATNSGWTQVVIDGSTTLTRASASFTNGTWQWDGAANPFSTAGTAHTCVWT